MAVAQEIVVDFFLGDGLMAEELYLYLHFPIKSDRSRGEGFKINTDAGGYISPRGGFL